MNIPLTSVDVTDARTTDRQLIDGLQQTLHANHARLLEAAKKEWESKFSGNDPSDACVAVRITTDAPVRRLACAGLIGRSKAGSPIGSRRGVPA